MRYRLRYIIRQDFSNFLPGCCVFFVTNITIRFRHFNNFVTYFIKRLIIALHLVRTKIHDISNNSTS